MRKLSGRTSWIASGLLLSTALPGCARPTDAPPAAVSVPVAVTVKDRPPAELQRCADRPDGLPEDPALIAQIPTKIRAGIIRLPRAFAGNATQLDRLVNWSAPGTCPDKNGKEAK